MARNERFELAGPAGELEAILIHPDEAPIAAGVVCHAHPLHGGIMHFKVVFRAAKALQRQGVAALRFNFRGVGESEGVHDQGRGEQDDVRAALDETARRFPGLPLVLGGFSFGAHMALRVGLPDPRVRALFALGFPLSHVPDASFLDGARKPLLFVQGERDVFGSGDSIRDLAQRLSAPRTVVVIPESDHFFTHHLDALEQATSAWLERRPWDAPG